MKAVKDILTGLDGESYAVIKIVGCLIVLVFLGLSIAAFVTGKPFDAVAYGTASALSVGAMGAAIKLTESSEPKGPPK